MKMSEAVQFISGTPQFRINECMERQAPIYSVYNQANLLEDLTGISSSEFEGNKIRTWDNVNTLAVSDVLFSLISGEATIIKKEHEGYLYTQNYIKLIPNEYVEPQYLVYLLNQDRSLERQLTMGLQGSQVLKYTLKQVKDLEMPPLPSVEKQRMVGDVYLKQLRLQAIKERATKLKTMILFRKLEEVTQNA